MKIDLRWIEPDKLALEVKPGVVIIHQRDHIRRDQWNITILSPDNLRAMARELDR